MRTADLKVGIVGSASNNRFPGTATTIVWCCLERLQKLVDRADRTILYTLRHIMTSF
jgi:hypothetical protein